MNGFHLRWRARIEAEIARLIALLDADDARRADMEPDADGEAEPDEVSRQPLTLAPLRAPCRVIRPTAAQQRAAYRRIGAPVPRNLRRGLLGSAHA